MRRSPGPGKLALAVLGLAALGAGAWSAACTTFSDAAAVEPDAGEPEPDAGPSTVAFLSSVDAAKVCAMALSCPGLASSLIASTSVPIDSSNFSMCMTWLAGPLPPNRVGLAVQQQTLVCVAAATDCIGAGECLSIEYLQNDDPRCVGHGGGGGGGGAAEVFCSADGTDVVHCDSQYILHCDTPFFIPGTTCLNGADGTLWCSSGADCVGAEACTGTVLEYCGSPSDLRFSVNCAAVGTTCGLDPDLGYFDCLTDGKRRNCSGTGASCAGSIVEVCDNFEVSTFDCPSIGRACDASQGLARCASGNDACTPFDLDVNVCEGSNIALCLGGQRVSFDCASAGLACVPTGASLGHCE